MKPRLIAGPILGLMFSISNAMAEEPKSAPRFQLEKSFPSDLGYRQSLGEPFRIVTDSLCFYGSNGKLKRTISLQREADGYARTPHLATKGAAVVRSKSGYEWANWTLEFYSDQGDLLATLPAPNKFLLSKNGDRVIVPNLTRAVFTTATGDSTFGLYDNYGHLIARHGVLPPGRGNQHFAFFAKNELWAVIFTDSDYPPGQGGISLYSASDGKVQMEYRTSEWNAQFGHLNNRQFGGLEAMAAVDAKNRVLVADGQNLTTSSRERRGISFNGEVLWRAPIPDSPLFRQMLEVNSVAGNILAIEFSPEIVTIQKLDSKSGRELIKRVVSRGKGTVEVASVDFSPQGHMLLYFNEREAKQSHTVSLFSSDLEVLGAESWTSPSTEMANFASDGRVVIWREKTVQIGRFGPI